MQAKIPRIVDVLANVQAEQPEGLQIPEEAQVPEQLEPQTKCPGSILEQIHHVQPEVFV